jgi:hypothetical protein
MTWSGKLLLRDGKLEQGAELMKGFAEAFPEYAAEAVRNADVLAVAWYDSGDEPAAQAVLDWIRARMAPLLEGEDRQAGSVRTALEKMKVTDLLAGD